MRKKIHLNFSAHKSLSASQIRYSFHFGLFSFTQFICKKYKNQHGTEQIQGFLLCLKSVNSKEPNVPDIKLPKRKQILINGEHFWNFCFYSTLDCYKLWAEISGILIKGGYGLGWGSHQLPERPDGDSITNSNINVSFVSHWDSAQNKETATPFFYSIDRFSAFWGHKSLRQSLFASRRG